MDMNYNPLPTDWKKQVGEQPPFTMDQLRSKSPSLLLEKVHRSMRFEFYSTITVFLIALVSLLMVDLNGISRLLCWLGLVVNVALFALYYVRFFRFYRDSSQLVLNSYENMLGLYYDFRHIIEVYRSFYLVSLLVGLAFGSILGSIEGGNVEPIELTHPDHYVGWLVLTMLVFFGALVGIVEWWIHLVYGKPLQAIKSLLEELKEEMS